ncbi:MAG: PEP-CTERM sorting domain-containing protein [Pseudomonadota bacterium]
MFKRASALLGVTMLFFSAAAHSTDFRYEFTATGSFVKYGSFPTSDTRASISFVLWAPSPQEVPTLVKSVSAVLDGHTYSLSEVGIQAAGPGNFFIGGSLNGVTGMNYGTDDFYTYTNFRNFDFSVAGGTALGGPYPGQGTGLFNFTSSKHPDEVWDWTTYSQSYGQIAAVPEPDTYGMLLAGLGVIGLFSRRRKSV